MYDQKARLFVQYLIIYNNENGKEIAKYKVGPQKLLKTEK